jgi:hypothetical protein
MGEKRPKPVLLAAAVVAAGILVPVLFHQVGLGAVFLPMFLPIGLGAFFLPLWLVLLAGVLTPLLSSLLTGMPPLLPPVAPVLSLELALFGGIVAYLDRKGWRPFWAVLLAFAVNRVVLLLVAWPLAPLLGLPEKLFGAGAVLFGLPGILLNLFLVPIFIPRLKGVLNQAGD